MDMRQVMGHVSGLQPLVELLLEGLVRESLAPESRVGDAGLGERTVEVEHADQPRPLPGPVGDGQDRRAVSDEAGQDVVGVLPHRLGDDDRRAQVDLREDLEALLLARDEPVLARRVVRVRPLHLDVERVQRRDDLPLHRFLRRPADFVGALAQIAARRQKNLFPRGHAITSHHPYRSANSDRRPPFGLCPRLQRFAGTGHGRRESL